MLRHPLIVFFALGLSTLALAEDWWDGSSGYESSGGFHTTLNNGKTVGTPNTTFQQNLSNYVGSQGQNSAPQINPATGNYETPAERIIRESKIPANLAPDPRKETIATNGDPSSPGRLGLDEKLTEASSIAKSGVAGEKAQMIVVGVGYAETAIMAFTDPTAAAQEGAKLDKQMDVYKTNSAALGAAEGDFSRGASKLTRDSYLADPTAPTVPGGTAGAPGAPATSATAGNANPGTANPGTGAKVSNDDGAKKDMADKILSNLSTEKQDFLRDMGVSASDFADRIASGEFKTVQDAQDFISRSAGGTPDERGARALAGDAGSDRRDLGSVNGNDEGAVLSVKSGVTLSSVPQKDAATKELVNSLASYLTSNAKSRGLRVVDEDQGDVSDKEKRALLTFAMEYWKKVQNLEDRFNQGGLFGGEQDDATTVGRRRTIFDMASDGFRKFGNDRQAPKTKGPVASR